MDEKHTEPIQPARALVVLAQKSQLAANRQQELLSQYEAPYELARRIIAGSESITVTDESQTDEMAKAREARLKLRNIRIQVEKKRKELKENALREGKAVDGLANIVKNMIEPEEARLEEQEKFIENARNKRLDEQLGRRQNELKQYLEAGVFGDYAFPAGLREMDDEKYSEILALIRGAHAEREAREKALREEKAAAAKAEAEERQRINEENARLKEEADAATRKLRAANDKIAADKALQDQAEADRLEKERQLALAPDRDKIMVYINHLNEVRVPQVSRPEAQKLLDRIEGALEDISNKARKAAKQL